jgi:hypothetical protein
VEAANSDPRVSAKAPSVAVAATLVRIRHSMLNLRCQFRLESGHISLLERTGSMSALLGGSRRTFRSTRR